MKLLAYTIGGQTIGIDIGVWDDDMLSGNTAFLAIADGGTIPTDYVDISSTAYWDQFGGNTTLDAAEIKNEIIKLIPDEPTAQEYEILEGYMNVGIDSITNIDNNLTLGSILTNGFLSGVTDTKLATTGETSTGSVLKVWEVTGSTGKFNDVLRINGKFYAEWIKNIRTASRAVVTRYDDTDPLTNDNLGGMVILNPSGGLPFTGGSATEYWIGVDKSGVTRAGFDGDFKPLLVGGSSGQIQLVDSVGGQNLDPVSATPITWGQEDLKDTATFTHAANGSSITVLKTGVYELSYNINGSGAAGRVVPGIQFRKNSTVIAPTLSSDYARNAINDDTNNSLAPYLISLDADDVLDVVVFRLGDTGTVTTKTGASFVRVTYLG